MSCEHRLRHHSDVTWLGLSFRGTGLAKQISTRSKIPITISLKARAPSSLPHVPTVFKKVS